MNLPFYEFFAGGGMARVGLGVGWACAFANDDSETKARSYRANFKPAHELKVCDVARLTTADLPGRADLAWASPPCVGASLAGGRKGLGAEAWAFLTLMQNLRAEGRAPRLVVIENVPAMLTSLGGKDFDKVCDMLEGAGYCYGAVIIDAALFAPQSRERLFVVAIDKTLPIPVELVTDEPNGSFHPPGLVKALRRQRAKPIWLKLPIPPPHSRTLSDILDGRGMDWDPPSKTAEFIGMMYEPHLIRLAEDKRAGKLVVRSINWRTRGAVTRLGISART